MRTKYFFGLVVTGASVAWLIGGCGPDGTGSTRGGGGDDTTTSSSSTSSASSSSAASSSSSSSGKMGDGNDSFDEAQPVDLGEGFQETLDPVEDDEDFISFTAKAGQRLVFQTDAKPD